MSVSNVLIALAAFAVALALGVPVAQTNPVTSASVPVQRQEDAPVPAPAPAAASSAEAAPMTLGAMDLSLTVFTSQSASSVDQSKNYVIFAYDKDACVGDKEAKCKALESALAEAVSKDVSGDKFGKYREHLSFGKANKDDFPEHKKEFEKAKVPLPAVLFWPAGHSRPSCKFDSSQPTGNMVSDWLFAKLKEEEEDDLLQLDEDADSKADALEDVSLLVCQADGGPNVVAQADPSCADLMDGDQGLVQVEKTQKVWDFKEGTQKFIGPADNSLPHGTNNKEGTISSVDVPAFQDLAKKGQYSALYFYAPWCHYCECLEPVWKGVSGNLVTSQRQPNLVVGKVDGDASPQLRQLFNVTAYPTFVVVNKDGTKVLGRYLGPRKVFELSNWIEDLIVADENPVVKKQFEKSEEGEHVDMHPVFPYTGPKAFGENLGAQNLLQLTGNDFDECLASDEAKFTAPGAALLVHYDAPRSLEFDGDVVNTEKVPEKLTVIDFYAPWCPHCQKLNPVWDSVTEKEKDVVVGKVNVDAHPDIKKQFGIKRFPTIMYFKPGQKMAYDEERRYKGQRDEQSLSGWIDSLKGQ